VKYSSFVFLKAAPVSDADSNLIHSYKECYHSRCYIHDLAHKYFSSLVTQLYSLSLPFSSL